MNKSIKYSMLIDDNAQLMSGVFTSSDIANLLGTSEKTLLPRRIRQLVKAGVFLKFVRGFYLYKKHFELRALSQRLCEKSYISLESVLAKKLIIGPVPRFRVTAVKIGTRRIYKNNEFVVEHVGIGPHLFFGFKTEGGVNEADAEKAFLDCLYFYQKGRRPSFNIYADVNMKRLDLKKVRTYLKKFRNPKFVAFVENILNQENDQ